MEEFHKRWMMEQKSFEENFKELNNDVKELRMKVKNAAQGEICCDRSRRGRVVHNSRD